MALKFGTSGIRGLVSELTDEHVFLLTTAFLRHAAALSTFSKVYVGRDLRDSSPRIELSVRRAIYEFSPELQILTCGILPTPALSYIASGQLAVMVTGSHIPADRNGLKFYLQEGETLKHDDSSIYRNYLDLIEHGFSPQLFNRSGDFLEAFETPCQDFSEEARTEFTRRYLNFFSPTTLSGTKILFYAHSSAARTILPEVLSKLGAQVVVLGIEEKFIPVDTEAVESLEQFKEWLDQYHADVLVSTDGDGDRPLIIDGNGQLIQGDKVGFLTALYLQVKALAIPISCNSEIAHNTNFTEVRLTKIGSPYVIDELIDLAKNFSSVAGFEANGGFILKSRVSLDHSTLESLPTRDSFLPIICCLALAKRTRLTLSQLLTQNLHSDTSNALIRNCPPEKSDMFLQSLNAAPKETLEKLGLSSILVQDISLLDGARITLNQGRVVHFRQSGNAPELRIYVEAKDKSTTEALALTLQQNLRRFLEQIG